MIKDFKSLRSGIAVLLIGAGLYVAYIIGTTTPSAATKGELQTEMTALIQERKKDLANVENDITTLNNLAIRLDSAAKKIGRKLAKELVEPTVSEDWAGGLPTVDHFYSIASSLHDRTYGTVANDLADFTALYYEELRKHRPADVEASKRSPLDQIRYDVGKEVSVVLHFGKWRELEIDSVRNVAQAQAFVEAIRAAYAADRVRDNLSTLKMKLEGFITDALQAAGRMRADADLVRQELTNMEVDLEEVQSATRDRVTLTVALPIFGAIVVLILIVPVIYHNGSTIDSQSVLVEMFSKGLLLRLFTVFILTVAIMILGIGGQIKGETLGTLLGAISAYVLQSSFGKEPERNGNNLPPQQAPEPAPEEPQQPPAA